MKLEGRKVSRLRCQKMGNHQPTCYTVGARCRSHLDVCKSNFANQDSRSIDIVIQKMENAFESIGGKICRIYYKNKMQILMNNFKHTCRKIIVDGKERINSTLTPRQWDGLKERMCFKYFLANNK